jgi:hypothetical protein
MISVKEIGPPPDCYLKFIDEKKRDNNCYVCVLNVDLVLNLPEVTA